ncbi:BsuPI-related putative proteinase inhibitor [Fredinandcohnia sp. 179-A 10B2 NHS]|uniref:BsuPI-related putative proteinase inhibitor n=1 Tax=Fredinandcohnia sp. 179-A 10B2 NHS TaxID=3235176 RepID=UPI0039A28366
MKKRNKWNLVVGSAFVFALLTGCGTGASTDKTQGAETAEKAEVKANFHTSIETKEEGNSVFVTYKFKNTSGKSQKLTIPSGLQVDYILYDKEGKKLRQYSNEVVSTQAIEELVLKNDEEIIQEFQIDGLEKGEYVLEVFLRADEDPGLVKTDIIINESLYTEGSGVLVGQIDPHSVEIKMNGTASAFQLSDEAIQQLSSLEDGDTISFVYSKEGDVQTIKSFTLGNGSEKISLTKSLLEVDQKLVDLHTSFRETRDINVLKSITPFEVFKLYMYTKAGEDYETLYHFHNKADAIVDVDTFKKENMTSEASKQKNDFMLKLDQVREFQVVKTDENRVLISFTLPNETTTLEFKLSKGENGVWQALWNPFQ